MIVSPAQKKLLEAFNRKHKSHVRKPSKKAKAIRTLKYKAFKEMLRAAMKEGAEQDIGLWPYRFTTKKPLN